MVSLATAVSAVQSTTSFCNAVSAAAPTPALAFCKRIARLSSVVMLKSSGSAILTSNSFLISACKLSSDKELPPAAKKLLNYQSQLSFDEVLVSIFASAWLRLETSLLYLNVWFPGREEEGA